MKVPILFIILTVSTSLFGQKDFQIEPYDKIEWEFDMSFYPADYQQEKYILTENKFRHKVVRLKQTRILNLYFTKRKLFKSGEKKDIQKSIRYFQDNMNRKSYAIDMKSVDKQKLFAINSDNQYLNISDSLLNSYLKLDTLVVDFKEFFTEYSKMSDAAIRVADGVSFYISLQFISKNDTIDYSYQGNLYDSFQDTRIKEYLLYYDLMNKYNIFPHTNTADYFSEDYFNNVIIRYIAYKENTFERKVPDFEESLSE